MTAPAATRTSTSAASSPPTGRARPPAPDGRLVPIATATVAAGVLLTMLPLRSVYTDWTWLTVSVGCALPYLAVVISLRLQGRTQSWPVVVGLLASFLMLAWVFVPEHLFLGVLPTGGSFTDVRALIDDAHQTMQAEHAPLPSTPALRLLTAGATILLIALTDVLGVLWRKPLLAAAPLLEVLAVASATSSRAASPVYFAAAAVGFLLIMIVGTRLQDRDWGPSVDGSAGRLGGARRMAITGITAALIVPVILPSVSVNLLARAAHHNGTGSGSGSNLRIELNNTADLSGSLRRGNAVDLIRVQVAATDQPFYVRQVVLDRFNQSGWVQSSAGNERDYPLTDGNYPIAPGSRTGGDDGTSQQIDATFTILNLGGDTLPLLANPIVLQPVGGGRWEEGTATVQGVILQRNATYTEKANQPDPSEQALRSAPDFTSSGDPQLDDRFLGLPTVPREVSQLADRLTAGLTNEYDKARAISGYFTDSKNGFVYSLDTAPSDGRGALLTFLDKKRGYCQQFAAAAAVLMRAAKIPTRVVLGYTHQSPGSDGTFTITTADAHAWVEAYFSGIGWIPFDPTPLGGADAARVVTPPWVRGTSSTSGSNSASAAPSDQPSIGARRIAGDPAAGRAGSANTSGGLPWRGGLIVTGSLLLLFLLIAGPHLLRRQQRRTRLRRARTDGSPEPLWQELAAAATDRGALWPSTLTVGQVPSWLAEHGVDDQGTEAVATIANGVERARFSSQGSGELASDSVIGLDQALRRWARRTERRQRLSNWWFPRSLLSRGDRWLR
jgi:transglutaminase-like putative cysteine protease